MRTLEKRLTRIEIALFELLITYRMDLKDRAAGASGDQLKELQGLLEALREISKALRNEDDATD